MPASTHHIRHRAGHRLATGWIVDYYDDAPLLMAANLCGPLGTVMLLARAGPITELQFKSQI